MSSLTVTLDGLPPSVNHAYHHRAGGGKWRTAEAQAWQAGAALLIGHAARAAGWHLAARQRWTLAVVLTFPAWRGDLDNRLKSLIDAIRDALGVDDVYLVDLRVTRESGPARTQLTIGIGE